MRGDMRILDGIRAGEFQSEWWGGSLMGKGGVGVGSKKRTESMADDRGQYSRHLPPRAATRHLKWVLAVSGWGLR